MIAVWMTVLICAAAVGVAAMHFTYKMQALDTELSKEMLKTDKQIIYKQERKHDRTNVPEATAEEKE